MTASRSSGAREHVLARIRGALSQSGTDPVEIPREYRTSGPWKPGAPDTIELLVERLVDYKAIVHRAADAGGLITAITESLGAPTTLADGAAPAVVVPVGLDAGWVEAVRAAGFEVLTDSRTDPVPLDRLDTVVAVVTAARVAIADTGTIVLDGADDQGRRAITLVPDHHICVVRADQVVGTVPEGVALLAADRPQTWISGPSATSDIELSRVEGVHGPRTLEVIIAGPAAE